MRLIRGIKNTLIIDDSYNSSPAATMAALDTLSLILPSESDSQDSYEKPEEISSGVLLFFFGLLASCVGTCGFVFGLLAALD